MAEDRKMTPRWESEYGRFAERFAYVSDEGVCDLVGDMYIAGTTHIDATFAVRLLADRLEAVRADAVALAIELKRMWGIAGDKPEAAMYGEVVLVLERYLPRPR